MNPSNVLGVDARIILKLTFGEWVRKIWTRVIGIRIGTGEELL